MPEDAPFRSIQLSATPVRAFVEYALDNAVALAEEALLVPVTREQLQREQAEFDEVQDVRGQQQSGARPPC